MTSKISSVKLWKESVKRGSAMGALLVLVYFCIFPLAVMIMMEGWGRMDPPRNDWMLQEMMDHLAYSPVVLIFTMGFACILGILQFAWLHSREKLDFYHSLPVRRERFFVIQYLAGVILWLAPYAVNLFFALFLAGMRGYADGPIWIQAGKGVIVQLVCFLITYSSMALCMMLTGKIFAAILGMILMNLYMPGALLVMDSMHSVYFSTFVNMGGEMEDYMKLSPMYACADLLNRFLSAQRSSKDMLLGLFLLAALITAVCIYLYRQRRSESAGHAMAFSGIARAVKFLVVVPVSLALQLIFYSIGENEVWGMFGLVFGFLLCSALVEFIYRMDIREVFADKGQILVTFAVTLCILLFFRFDLSSYDKKLPDQNQVESMQLWNDGLSYLGVSMNERAQYNLLTTSEGKIVYQVQKYTGKEPYKISGQDLDTVYELLDHRLSRNENSRDGNYCGLKVTYNMKDGKTKERQYRFELEDLMAYCGSIWESQAYKEFVMPVLNVDSEKILDVTVGSEEYQGYVTADNVSLYVPSDSEELEEEYVEEISAEALQGEKLELTREEKEKLFETFCREMRGLTMEQLLERESAGFYEEEPLVTFVYLGEDGNVYGEMIYVDNTFPETKALLKEYGYQYRSYNEIEQGTELP